MTLFWILAAALTATVVAMLVRPLLRPAAAVPERSGWDLEVYRDQLAEIERDLGRGLIAAAQAEAARAEIGRRILALAPVDGAEREAATPPSRPNRITALALTAALPLAALSLYLVIGRPDLPARPFSEQAAATAKPEEMPQKVLDAVTHLAERLKSEPGNLEGWQLLAQSYGKLGRLPEAVEAWRKAAALAPDDAEISSNLAEALVFANQGLVPEDARQRFEAVQAKAPSDPRASHYLALARLQAGDDQGALDRWTKLVAASPANAPWLPLVRQSIAEVAGRLHLDPAAVTPKPLPAKEGGAAKDRAAALQNMAEELTAKLKTNPADADGWLRLIATYEALGNTPRRLEAARNAREQGPHRPELLVACAEAVIAAAASNSPDDRLPAEAAAALREALAVAPETPAALWYLGIDAAIAGNAAEARPMLEKLLKQLDPAGTDYKEVKTRLDELK